MGLITDIDSVEVIAPNFKRRLSGVTSTIIQLIPAQRNLGCEVVALGPGLPADIPHIRFRDIWRLWSRPKTAGFRVWHARRNIEMLAGVVLRDLLRMPLKLVFTSASQRNHTAWSKVLIRRMDHVLATSGKTAAYLEVPFEVCMHGIDTERFCPTDDKQNARRALGLPEDQKIAGCIGRIRYQKGTDRFVDAMIALLPTHPDWIGIIAGRTTAEHDGFEKELRAKIEASGLSGRILFVGEHKDIERWYQALDLFVAPQRWEGFGLTPLEAMACGVPVVATDVGAFSELVVDGVTGFVTENSDLALSTAARQVLGDDSLRARLRSACRSHIEKNFMLDREATQLNAAYKRLQKGG
jgi:mannosyltransferase